MPSTRRGARRAERAARTVARGVVVHTVRHARRPLKKAVATLPPASQSRVRALRKRLTGGAPVPKPVQPPPDPELVKAARASRSPVPDSARRLYVGPANFAGQGYLWARAVEARYADVGAVAMAVHRPGGFDYPVDHMVDHDVYARSAEWQEEEFDYVRTGFTDVLFEAQRAIAGRRYVGGAFTEARILQGSGLRVAMMGHGRDVRLPSRHRELYPYSPYLESEWSEVPALQAQVARNLDALHNHDFPMLVSTPDLLDDLPTASWCPVVVNPSRWVGTAVPLERERPVVVHAPTSANFKGSLQIDPVMQRLHDQGVIHYRRIENVPAAEMPALIGGADIVLEQFRLGSYGVTACEAMAAGRIVLGHVTDHNRKRVRELSGLDLPIVEATIDDIEEVLLSVLEAPDAFRDRAAASATFVREMHDGRRSAEMIAAAFGWGDTTS